MRDRAAERLLRWRGQHLHDRYQHSAKWVIYLDAILYLAGGILGTAHHWYFTGQSSMTSWSVRLPIESRKRRWVGLSPPRSDYSQRLRGMPRHSGRSRWHLDQRSNEEQYYCANGTADASLRLGDRKTGIRGMNIAADEKKNEQVPEQSLRSIVITDLTTQRPVTEILPRDAEFIWPDNWLPNDRLPSMRRPVVEWGSFRVRREAERSAQTGC